MKNKGVNQQDMHEAYQSLLKVIRAKNRFRAKAMEKQLMGDAPKEVKETVKKASKIFKKKAID